MHHILEMIEGCYDKADESNTFDLGVQPMTGSMITFPKVEEYTGCGANLPGFKSYPVYFQSYAAHLDRTCCFHLLCRSIHLSSRGYDARVPSYCRHEIGPKKKDINNEKKHMKNC